MQLVLLSGDHATFTHGCQPGRQDNYVTSSLGKRTLTMICYLLEN